MLNIINAGTEIDIQDGVSGISRDWNKSAYNKSKEAEKSMTDLIKDTNAKFILISYNNEGIIKEDKFRSILESFGSVEIMEKDYNTYRGSRNLKQRDNKVRELLWILEKKV
jgi:adenine-specific DNA-methyltransferase